MLSISLKSGEYLTIGENVVVQYRRTDGNRCFLSIEAPRDVKIMRGRLLEAQGGERPDCVFDQDPQTRWTRQLQWNRSKSQALAAMRRLLSEMEDNEQTQALRRQLEHIFPSK